MKKKEALNCTIYFIAADSTNNCIRFIWCIVVWSENKFSPNPAPVPVRFHFLDLARSSSGGFEQPQY